MCLMEKRHTCSGVKDSPGVLLPPLFSSQPQSHQDDSVLLVAPCLWPCLLPYASLPSRHFWLDWKEGDLGTYQLTMMSCLFFFFNKTEQNNNKKTRQLCLVDLFIIRDRGAPGVGRRGHHVVPSPVLHGKTTAKSRPAHLLPCSLFPGGFPRVMLSVFRLR